MIFFLTLIFLLAFIIFKHRKTEFQSRIGANEDVSSSVVKQLTRFRSESICVMKEDGKIGFRLKMAECQAEYCFLSSPPPPPPFLPSLLVSRPALPRTSVGMYPPLNRSRWATAGSLTAQYGSSINQRHFQCPITETLLLGLSEADSSPIHLLAGKKSHCGTPVAFTCSNAGLLRAQEDPSEIVFSRSGKQQKR